MVIGRGSRQQRRRHHRFSAADTEYPRLSDHFERGCWRALRGQKHAPFFQPPVLWGKHRLTRRPLCKLGIQLERSGLQVQVLRDFAHTHVEHHGKHERVDIQRRAWHRRALFYSGCISHRKSYGHKLCAIRREESHSERGNCQYGFL